MDRDIVYALEREQNLKTNEFCKEKQKMKRWHVKTESSNLYHNFFRKPMKFLKFHRRPQALQLKFNIKGG